ncbi:MAG: RNA polymerase sigma factor [Bacteroidota bacterium]
MQKQNDIGKCWQAMIQGDRSAFEQLFVQTYTPLLLAGLRTHPHRDLVKDHLQDLFVEIWQKRERLREVQHPLAYLQQILRRKIIKSLNQPNAKAAPLVQSDQASPSYESLLIQQQQTQEQKEKLKAAFNQLTNRQKEIIELRFFQDLSYEEIAEKTAAQKRTIYNQMHTALKILKKSMLFQLFFLMP